MPLTNLNAVKSYLRINDNSDDDFLTILIGSVQTTIETYCHRHFDISTYTEKHKINHKIFPHETPIISIGSILRYGDAADYVPDYGAITNYKIFPSYIDLLDCKYLTMTNRLQYANHEESYAEITYTAGYETPPADLSLAAIKLIALEYKESRENRIGIESESEGDVKYTYFKKETEMPLNISSVLDRYKRIRV